MKELQVKITVPKKGEKWKVSIGSSHGRHRARANTVIEYLSKRFLTAGIRTKINVYVSYAMVGQFHNDGVYTDPYTALYAVTCFLEDYLTADTFRTLSRKYFKESQKRGGE